MAITNEFMEAVQSGKTIRVRIMLKDSLLIDPTAAQFNEMEKYAAERMDDIYTEHDGEKLNFDVNAWNEEYLNQQMVAVVNCFSRERIDLLKSMVRYLYKDKVNRIRSEMNQNYVQNHIARKAGTGMAAAGAALTVAGICTSNMVLTIGGVSVAAAGVILIISDKGDA